MSATDELTPDTPAAANGTTPVHVAGSRVRGAPVADPNEILKHSALPTEEVWIPRLGQTWLCRGMGARELDEFQAGLVQHQGTKHQRVSTSLYRVGLVIRGVIKPNGDQMFGEEHTQRLANMPADVITPAADAVARLSGLTKADEQDLTEGTEGNS